MKFKVLAKGAIVDDGKLKVQLPNEEIFETADKAVIDLLKKSVSVEELKEGKDGTDKSASAKVPNDPVPDAK